MATSCIEIRLGFSGGFAGEDLLSILRILDWIVRRIRLKAGVQGVDVFRQFLSKPFDKTR